MKITIEVVECDTEKVIKIFTAYSQRRADLIENGLIRQLNHDKYFTRIVKENQQ